MENIDELKKAHKRVTKMLDEASKTNTNNELDLDSFGVNINFQLNKSNSNNLFISILDYNGYSIIELTPKEIKELKKFVSEL
jgi:uncharacterized FlaG/YvyC family protein